MKKTMMALLAVGLVAAATGARAHDEGGKAPRHRPEMAEHMREAMGLSDDQAAKMKSAMKAHRDATKPIRRKMEDLQEKLSDQLDAKASDKDLQATLDQMSAARKDLQAQREKMEASVAAILTPTQRAKMVLGMLRHMERMRHGGMGMRGPGGPGGPGGDMGPGGAGGPDQPGPDRDDDE